MKIIFFGPQGSGKGTYAQRIGPVLNIPHVSTGDILRAEIATKSALGRKVEAMINAGQLAPDEIVIAIIRKRLAQPDAAKGYILDGYPRNLLQAEALDNIAPPDVVLNLHLAEDILIEKLSARRICRNCGNIYNIADIKRGKVHLPPLLPKKPGICDKCGGALIQRDDDKPEAIRKRLELYHKQSEPLIKYYRDRGLVRDIEVTGPPDVVVPVIMAALEGFKKVKK